jgi:hypothetical protein
MLRVAVFSLSSFIYNAYDFMRCVIQLGGHGGKRQINHPAASGWGIEKTAIKN